MPFTCKSNHKTRQMRQQLQNKETNSPGAINQRFTLSQVDYHGITTSIYIYIVYSIITTRRMPRMHPPSNQGFPSNRLCLCGACSATCYSLDPLLWRGVVSELDRLTIYQHGIVNYLAVVVQLLVYIISYTTIYNYVYIYIYITIT